MADRVREVLGHPAGQTAAATLAGYLVILVVMTGILFGGSYLLFRVFG